MTICFKHEWFHRNGQPRAILHHTTKNESFIRTCMILKKMGIKNYAFPLSLYDPDLLNVDVFDLEEDTPENQILRTKVQIEASRNRWYYLRECLRIYEQGGAPVRFRLDRSSCAMTWWFTNGIDYYSMAPRQTGKDQPLYSKIRTPDGWKRMGDIYPGDKAVAQDGSISEVIGVYPQGFRPIYRIHFEDGRYTDCGKEHLWMVHNKHWDENGWKIVLLSDIMEYLEYAPKDCDDLSIPVVVPEQTYHADLPVDPYILGALIAGEEGTSSDLVFKASHRFVIKEINRLLPLGNKVFHKEQNIYQIVCDSSNGRPRSSPLESDLKKKKILPFRRTKNVIPEIYKKASPLQKLHLLQGLMDVKGSVDGNSEVYFKCKNKYLAEEVRELVWSLGGISSIKTLFSMKSRRTSAHQNKTEYYVSVLIPNLTEVFRNPRSKDSICDSYKTKKTLKLGIKSVEYIGEEKTQCIEIDHPDHLYVTDNYIVTHNTVCALALTSHVLYTAGYEYTIGMMANNDNLRQINVKRVKSFGENLPDWWRVKDRNKDKNNSQEIYYEALKTHYVTFVAQADKSAADKIGRGGTMPMLHFDEFEFIVNIGTTYPVIMASGQAARTNAKKNGKPYSNIITTTAGDPSKPECREAMAIVDGAMSHTELLYDSENIDSLHQIVESASPQKMVLGIFSHHQLGYDNKWFKDQVAKNRYTKEQAERDLLNRRVAIQDQPVISKDILARINASQREVKDIQVINEKFVIYWYISKEYRMSDEFKNTSIVVGCDSSEMIGRDSTTLVGVDPRNLSVVFTFRCNEGNINVVGTAIGQLLLMFPKMIFVPENKSSGTSIIDIVTTVLRQVKVNPFMRIFNWVVNNRDQKEFQGIDIRDMNLLDSSVRKFFGIKTDKEKRNALYSQVLLDACELAADLIKDQTLIQELNSLTVRNGRVDHASGGNDDTVIAWLLAMFFIFHAKNLSLYGINPGTNMSQIIQSKDQHDNSEELKRSELIKLKIEELTENLKKQSNPSTRKLIESEIRLLSQKISNTTATIPLNAEEFHRDPKRYVDPAVVSSIRPQHSSEDIERSIRALFNV